ncbi:hypothetical protein P691DRAFT_789879 [Macrolepiota fuliginosa MF-IS2]|uniref:Uncharacterized protein n=1 Tax=Macrolepiota fuliginosa MF-IS2 TaxID=1400762 RepID=A0A9P5X3K3_9AGAR|nr:hypothetical protein P691DRAFT_789879 [Macrolepiota fuliginosa MF-IS2]
MGWVSKEDLAVNHALALPLLVSLPGTGGDLDSGVVLPFRVGIVGSGFGSGTTEGITGRNSGSGVVLRLRFAGITGGSGILLRNGGITGGSGVLLRNGGITCACTAGIGIGNAPEVELTRTEVPILEVVQLGTLAAMSSPDNTDLFWALNKERQENPNERVPTHWEIWIHSVVWGRGGCESKGVAVTVEGNKQKQIRPGTHMVTLGQKGNVFVSTTASARRCLVTQMTVVNTEEPTRDDSDED